MMQWQRLAPREQWLIGGAAVMVLLAMLYVSLLEPLWQRDQMLRQRLDTQRQELAWMEWAASEVVRLQQQGRVVAKPGNRSLMGLVDGSARRQGLTDAIKRIEPQGKAVQVRLEQVEFDKMLAWLDQLIEREGVEVSGMVVERQEVVGRVNCRLVIGVPER